MPFLARFIRSVAACTLVIFGICAVGVAIFSHNPGSGTDRRHSLMMVTSGSMVPVFHAGDAIVVRSADETTLAALRPGRIITFRAGKAGQLVTHRIMSVIRHPDGRTEFVTRGDANPGPDLTPVDPADVVGTVSSVVPFGGYVMRALGDRRVPVLLLCAVILGNWSVAFSSPRRPKGCPALSGDNTHPHTTKGTST